MPWQTGKFSWKELCYSAGKGALVSGAATTVSAVAIQATAPLWMALTAGITTAIAVKQGVGVVEKLWQRIWPTFESFGKKFPSVVQQMPISIFEKYLSPLAITI